MIYKCENEKCGFLFSRMEQPSVCPDCAKEVIREADDEEQQEFEKNRKEKEYEGKK